MWHIEKDYVPASPVSSLAIRRTYNSDPLNWDAAVVRSFGARWTQNYDAVLKAEIVPPTGSGWAKCWRRKDTLELVYCETSGLIPPALPGAASIVRGDGKRHFFKLEAGVWKGDADNSDTLTSTYNSDKTAVVEWIYQSRGDVTERYSSTGQRISATGRNGVTQRFTYSNGTTNDSNVGKSPANAPACNHVQAGAALPEGKLMCVTDSLGYQLHFEYDLGGRIVKAIDPAGQAYTYEYDGASGGCVSPDPLNAACSANNLTKVTYPDATSRTYLYNESARINDGVACAGITGVGNGFGHLLNAWTGYIDENGDRHISWTYDCRGRAISSERAEGVEKVRIAYGAGEPSLSAVVEHFTGLPSSPVTTSTTYNYTRILGSAKNTSMDKPCIECGDYSARTYDVNGNDSSLKDWRGNLSCFAYDLSRNLETSRVEGAAGTATCSTLMTATTLAAPMRKINTKWHAKYRLPLQVSEPKKRITYDYDAAGNLLVKTEQATSDETGALGFAATLVGTPRTWKYTVNSIGQVLTITGPRTDAVDRTTFTYDTAGNLQTATDALNRSTRFSNYDKHGNARRVDAPNGVWTELDYSPRGKLLSKTVRSAGLLAKTTYQYDDAGNMKKTTMPDNSTIDYTYDAAHRLTAVTDSRGNRIDYVLDLTGNRVSEEVRDPNGTLARQVSRTFDTMGRMTSQTGAAQ